MPESSPRRYGENLVNLILERACHGASGTSPGLHAGLVLPIYLMHRTELRTAGHCLQFKIHGPCSDGSLICDYGFLQVAQESMALLVRKSDVDEQSVFSDQI